MDVANKPIEPSPRPWSRHQLGDFGLLDIRAADGKPVAFTGAANRTKEENEANAELIVLASNAYVATETIAEIAMLKRELLAARLMLRSVQRIALETFNYWDADEDHKVGKILKALSGAMPGYRDDVDQIIKAGNDDV